MILAAVLGFLSLWGHAVAALVFAAAALVAARRGGQPRPLILALSVTALWAVTAAGAGPDSTGALLGETLRNLAWLALMAALLRAGTGDRPLGLIACYVAVAGVMLVNLLVTVALSGGGAGAAPPAAAYSIAAALRMVASAGGLFLLHQLYGAAGAATRGPVRVTVWALALTWLFDFNLYAVACAEGAFPIGIARLRGPMMIGTGAALLLAVHRGGDWRLSVSRHLTMRTLSGALFVAYLAVMLLGTALLGAIGGEAGRIAQAAFVLGASAAMLALLPHGRAAAWLRVKVAKHLFQHRYDYRSEWTRFTQTLGRAEDAAAPLPERVVKAVADIMSAPAGLLYLPDGDRLAVGAAWNWPAADVPDAPIGGGLGAYMLRGDRVVELDAVRRDEVPDAEIALIPQGLIDAHAAWVLVPIVHVDRLAGIVVLARPLLTRALDWEDFDLLRVVGRQVASYLAERQGQRALDDARRFDEFNRRFAFVMHDIKNLVSQLSLVARNAERHADNPAFRADMVATLQDSAARMNALLARLAQHNSAVPDEPRAVVLAPLIEGVIARAAAQHPVVAGRMVPITALVDPARLEKLIGHLLQNAIQASGADAPVRVALHEAGGRAAIEIADNGCGMTPEFVREKLFTPFASTKPGGFGIGAHEARQLAEAMGGTIEVASRPGEGSRFTVLLPIAGERAMERAA